jgi:hypothetical protein
MRAKLPEFATRLSALTREMIAADFEIEKWVKDSCRARFAEKLTSAELRRLNTYFRTPSGKKTVSLFSEIILQGVRGGGEEPAKADVDDMEKFLKQPDGTKFFDVFMEDVFGDIKTRTDEWSDKLQARLEKSTSEGEMKQLMEEFFGKLIKG